MSARDIQPEQDYPAREAMIGTPEPAPDIDIRKRSIFFRIHQALILVAFAVCVAGTVGITTIACIAAIRGGFGGVEFVVMSAGVGAVPYVFGSVLTFVFRKSYAGTSVLFLGIVLMTAHGVWAHYVVHSPHFDPP